MTHLSQNKSLAQVFRRGLEGFAGKSLTIADAGRLLGARNFTGKPVATANALQLSTVWACVRLISETLSTLPMNLYRDTREGVREPAPDHPLYLLLHTQPNYQMTAAVFWQAVIASLLLRGEAFIEKVATSRGVLTALNFLQPECMTYRVQPDGSIEWHYADPLTHRARVISEEAMWFIPAFTLNGVRGLSPISMGANVFGNSIAADEASANTFRNGMKASGLVTMDGVLQSAQREQIRSHMQQVSQSGGFFVLERGTSFQQLSMTPQDAELLATRSFNIEEICRWFRVPPFMVGHSEKSTSWGTGIEQQMIGFVTFVLRPWAVRIEQSIKKHLMSPAERLTLSAEFSLEGLLRGDSAARASFYSSMTQNGVMTRDECRRLENLPLMGGNAAALTVQSNLLPIDDLGKQATTPAPAVDEPDEPKEPGDTHEPDDQSL